MDLRWFVGTFLAAMSLSTAASTQTEVTKGTAKALPEWYQRGVTAALLDPTPGVAAEVLQLPRAEDAIAAIRTGDPDQRKVAVDALLKLAASRNTYLQQSAAAALAMVSPDNADQRKAAVEALLKLASSPDETSQKSAAAALATLPPDDAQQRKAAVEVLLKLIAGSDWGVAVSAADALARIPPEDANQRVAAIKELVEKAQRNFFFVGSELIANALAALLKNGTDQRKTMINSIIKLAAKPIPDVQLVFAFWMLAMIPPYSPEQRNAIIEALPKLTTSKLSLVRGVTTAATESFANSGPNQRKVVVDALLKLAASPNRDQQQAAAERLATVAPDNSDQRKAVVDAMLKLAANRDKDLQGASAVALANVPPDNAHQRKAVVDAMLKLAANWDEHLQEASAFALARVPPDNAAQRKAVVDAMLKLTASKSKYSSTPRLAAATLASVLPDNADQRKAVVEVLLKSNEITTIEDQHIVYAQLLAKVVKDADDQRNTVVEALLTRVASSPTDVQSFAAEALGMISPDNVGQQKAVIDALSRLAASSIPILQMSAADALAKLRPDNAEQRKAIIGTLLELAASRNAEVRRSATAALFEFGPIDVEQMMYFLARIGHDGAANAVILRATGWAFNGSLPTANDGANLLTFTGRPDTIPVDRLPKTPKAAGPILAAFEKHWADAAPSKELQIEIAEQSNAIVRRVCPAAENISATSFLEEVSGRIRQEWGQTIIWLRGWFAATDGRCWQGDALRTLAALSEDFGKVDGLVSYQRELNMARAADGARPVFGQAVLTGACWTLLWTAFLVVFPFSPRARALYLFNEKARGALSLWFLPMIMTLLPVLRRRMLLPFREQLLADAHLSVMKEGEFYPGLRVLDRQGAISPIAEAILDVSGRLLLIGEAGLGKSTYLRTLTSRSRRTIAYLNARSCDKGVVAAIVERVSGFESPEFFKGLIYTGDLAVVIDGLNEVNADMRMQIIAFANSAGHPNVIIATQPIEGIGGDRSPLTLATPYELLPLTRVDITKFLKSRPLRDSASSLVKGEHYDRAVDSLLARALDRTPENEAEREAETVLREGHSAQLILSNPMDLTYGSELIAMGQTPQPSQLIGQAFRLACEKYRAINDREFPTLEFARKTVGLRREDRNWLRRDEFANEQDVLAEFRLVVPRTMKETADNEIMVMRFRHDKVTDVVTKRAFEVDKGLQTELINDPRFRGVYLLFAQDADRLLARRIRDLLVSRAARTGDNALSNEFVRLFDEGPAVKADA